VREFISKTPQAIIAFNHNLLRPDSEVWKAGWDLMTGAINKGIDQVDQSTGALNGN